MGGEVAEDKEKSVEVQIRKILCDMKCGVACQCRSLEGCQEYQLAEAKIEVIIQTQIFKHGENMLDLVKDKMALIDGFLAKIEKPK